MLVRYHRVLQLEDVAVVGAAVAANVDDESTGFSALVVVLLLRLPPCDGVAVDFVHAAAGENEQ